MSTAIEYVVGDATLPKGAGPMVIAHVCNDVGGWGKGFVKALSARWDLPEREYRDWHANRAYDCFALGNVQVVCVAPGLWVANMVAQHGLGRSGRTPPIRYAALRSCLVSLARFVLDQHASVHMPRIGCGLAGGKWERVEPLVKEELCDRGISVTVYDPEEEKCFPTAP